MLLFHLLYFEVFTCGNLNAINKHVKQTKPIQLILLIISCFVHLFWLYNFLIYFSYYTYTLFLYFYTYILFLLYNDLYFRLAPSSNMPNGTQAFSLWLLFFPLPSVFFFFNSLPLVPNSSQFLERQTSCTTWMLYTLSFADKNNTKVIQSKHKPTFGVTVNYVLWTADVWKHLYK